MANDGICMDMKQAFVTTSTVMLVDDDEVFRRVLGKALSRRGYEVYSAASIDQARMQANKHRPACALVDLKLENESGLDLVPELRALDENMIIIVLTGYASIATAVTAIKRGATNYLAKPVKVDEVMQALSGNDSPSLAKHEFTPMSVDRLEWEHIQKVLQENDGNISATARSLGMYRRTLQRKLAKKPVQH